MRTEEREKGAILLKISLYCISLWILMFMLIVLKFDASLINKSMDWHTIKMIVLSNIFSIACILVILAGVVGLAYFKDCLNDAKRLPVEIEECKSVNYENLSFLATYVIPLVCFPLNNEREEFVLFAVILIIGMIFVKTNLYYTNPSLVLMGFNVYEVECKKQKGFDCGIVIAKGKLKANDTIRYMSLSDNIYFAKRI